MEVADIAIAPLKEFVRDSVRLVKKCTKPDRREFTLIASKTAFGASSRSSLSFFSHILDLGNQISRHRLTSSHQNSFSPPPSKHDRVYHVWVRRVLRETGLVSVSLRSRFALNQQSHRQNHHLDEIEYTGLFSPVVWRCDSTTLARSTDGCFFFLFTQHTN